MLDGIATHCGIEVSDDELAEAYDALSGQVEESADELAARLSGTVQEKRITSDILRRKALDALVRGAVAVDTDGKVIDLQLDSPQNVSDESTDEAEDEADEPTAEESTETADGDGGSQENADEAD